MPSKTAAEAGKILAETLGKIRIDAFVFLFQRDGKCQDLFFGETVEGPHIPYDA